MKILFVTKELPYPVNSGARMRSWHYIKGLARAGQVHVICGGCPEKNIEGMKALMVMGVDIVFVDVPAVTSVGGGIAGRLRSLLSILPHPVFLRVSTMFQEKVNEVVKESECDLLVCDGIHMALNVPLQVSCRKILDEHNVESTIIGRFFRLIKNPFLKIYVFLEWLKFRRFEETVWKKFDEVHVCSDVDKRKVEKRSGHRNVHVVPNGVDCQENGGCLPAGKAGKIEDVNGQSRNSSINKTSLRLVYSGLMGWMPNNDAAVYFIKKIWPLIKRAQEHKSTGAQDHKITKTQEYKSTRAQDVSCDHVLMAPCAPVEFFIVGKDPSDAVKALAENDPSITVTGCVDDVKPYIDESDIFIVPLRIGSGTRLKILEAMAMGKPVVSTSIGCEGLDVAHGETILIADNPQLFADCVVSLLNNPDQGRELASAARKLVKERYHWPVIENSIADLIIDPVVEAVC